MKLKVPAIYLDFLSIEHNEALLRLSWDPRRLAPFVWISSDDGWSGDYIEALRGPVRAVKLDPSAGYLLLIYAGSPANDNGQ